MSAGEDEAGSPEPEQEVGFVRTAVAAYVRAFGDGETEAFLALLDEDAVLEIPSALRQEVVRLHGRDEVQQYLEETGGEYSEFGVDAREFRPLDRGRLLVIGRWRGRASGGTTPFGTPLALLVELREAKIASIRAFMDEQQALDAVGGD